jgi:hypothetical protein
MAGPTLLGLTQEFCKRRGLPIPTSVSGSSDPTVLQIWGLLNEVVQTLVERFEWQTRRGRFSFMHQNLNTTFISYGALYLGELDSPLPDLRHMLNRTLWDSTNRREVSGPLTPKEWEALIHMGGSQAAYSYTVMDNYLCIYPVPVPQESVTFTCEWLSRYSVLTGGQGGDSFLNDGSSCVYPTAILLADLKWRWAAAKGLPYAEDFRTAEELIVNLMGREAAPDLHLDEGGESRVGPGLLVAAGNWPLP